jgi:hypothetical protein
MSTYKVHVTYPTPTGIFHWEYYSDMPDGSDIADRTAWMFTMESVGTRRVTLERIERINGAMACVRANWDSSDPWGSALSAMGGICDALSATGNGADIPASCGYRPAGGGITVEDIRQFDDYSGAREYLDMIEKGDDQDYTDLLKTLKTLDRYADILRAVGRDY